jgi:hypothetical protein
MPVCLIWQATTGQTVLRRRTGRCVRPTGQTGLHGRQPRRRCPAGAWPLLLQQLWKAGLRAGSWWCLTAHRSPPLRGAAPAHAPCTTEIQATPRARCPALQGLLLICLHKRRDAAAGHAHGDLRQVGCAAGCKRMAVCAHCPRLRASTLPPLACAAATHQWMQSGAGSVLPSMPALCAGCPCVPPALFKKLTPTSARAAGGLSRSLKPATGSCRWRRTQKSL